MVQAGHCVDEKYEYVEVHDQSNLSSAYISVGVGCWNCNIENKVLELGYFI